ncbi:MAG: ion channel [Fulvivirga sp.]
MAIWLLLMWLGLFLAFSSNPDAIVNSKGESASSIERLYFTGYVLSTLGIGNFKPITPFFELLTSLFSFFGFVFFTTSMTYLISVSSAIVHKRSLALTIRTLGENPAELVRHLFGQDRPFSSQQISDLRQMICRHTVNHQAYPVLHYYNNPDIASSLSINLTVLDEAVNILRYSTMKPLHKELQPLNNALDQFLQHVKKKYGAFAEAEDIPKINWLDLDLPDGIVQQEFEDHTALVSRRKILGALLQGEGFSWHDIYPGHVLR